MLHDRLMVKADGNGERRSGAGIVIPATAEVARRLVWERCSAWATTSAR